MKANFCKVKFHGLNAVGANPKGPFFYGAGSDGDVFQAPKWGRADLTDISLKGAEMFDGKVDE
ncbi:MAG: hypothetical protein F6K19_34935 [Cyanothece sp. SIO1E1]|nr:hypothetical protein [Cyanothece sp. SIO1E1]